MNLSIFFQILSDHPDVIDVIKSAMAEIESKTCIKFTPHSTERDYLFLFSGTG